MLAILFSVAIMGFTVVAGWLDLRRGNVPTVLVVTGFGVALTLRAGVGPEAHLMGLAGTGVGLLVILPLVALRVVDGSRLTTLVMVGAFLGPREMLVALAVTLGLVAVILAADRLRARFALQVVGRGRRALAGGPAIEEARTVTVGAPREPPRPLRVPYGAVIAVGAVTAWLL